MHALKRSRFSSLKIVLFILLQLPLFAFSFTSNSPTVGNVPVEKNLNISRFAPINERHLSEIFISRDTYLISWNPETRLLNWAAWKVEMTDFGTSGRSNNFLPDPDLQTYLQTQNKQAVVKEDFMGSCYDRGHQVPSADRTSSADINQLTFLMSNMIPQTAYLNRVIWEHMEHFTRDLVRTQNKKVYVIAGPIYDEDFGKIGPNNDIPVPSKNFKVLIAINQNEDINDPNVKPLIISVVMPNILKNGKKSFEDKDERCRESISLSDNQTPPPTNPTPGTPVPTPTPLPNPAQPIESVNGPSTATTGPATPQTPTNFDDWKQYQTDLNEIEKNSGFKIDSASGF